MSFLIESLPGLRQLANAIRGEIGSQFIQTEESFLLNEQEVIDIHQLAHPGDSEQESPVTPEALTPDAVQEDLNWFFDGKHAGIFPASGEKRTEVLFSGEHQKKFQKEKLKEISTQERSSKKKS